MLPPDELTRDQPKQETFLFKKGAAGDAAYIVHSGSVGVFKEIEDGPRHVYGSLGLTSFGISGSCSPAMMSPAATSLPTPTYSARAAFAP
jgi:CRP-like cAMP-binding protein